MAIKPFGSSGGVTSPTAGFGSAPEDEQSGFAVRGFNALIDLLSRGTYASAAAADILLDNKTQTFGQALKIVTDEALNPARKLTYSHVLKNAFPEFAKNNPISTSIFGFVGDIALDPLTYVGGSAMKVVGKGGRSAIVEGSKWRKFLQEYTTGMRESRSVDDLVKMGVEKYGVTDTPSMRAFATKTMEDSKALRDTLLTESAQRLDGFAKMAELNEAGFRDALAKARYGAKYDALDDASKAGIDILHADTLTGRIDAYAKDILEGRPGPSLASGSLQEQIARANAKDYAAAGEIQSQVDRATPAWNQGKGAKRTDAGQVRELAKETVPAADQPKLFHDVKRVYPTPMQNIPAPLGNPEIPGVPLVRDRIRPQPAMLEGTVRKAIAGFRKRQAEIGEKFHKEVANIDKKLVDHALVDRQLKGVVNDRYAQHVTEVSTRLFTKPTLQAAVGELEESAHEKVIAALLDNEGVRAAFSVKTPALLGFHVPFTEVYGTWGGAPMRALLDKVREATPLKRIGEKLDGLDALARENKKWYSAAYLKARQTGTSLAANLGKVTTGMRDMFDRFYDVPEELQEAIRHFQTETDNAARRITPALAEVFVQRKGDKFVSMGAEGRERIGRFMGKMDDLTGTAIKEGWHNTSTFREAVTSLRAESKLTAEEYGTVVKLRRAYDDMKQLETAAGLLEHEVVNYAPRFYDGIRDAKALTETRARALDGVALHFGPGEQRTIADLELAKKIGLNPVEDAAAIYARRVLQHHQAFAHKAFAERTSMLFGDAVKRSKSYDVTLDVKKLKAQGLTDHQAVKIADTITFVGEGLYSQRTNELVNAGLRAFDKLTGVMKRSATLFNPAFSFKQAVGNSINSSLVLPLRAGTLAGFFDPRTYADAWAAIIGKEGGEGGFKTLLGESVSAQQARKELVDEGIVRNKTLEGIPSGVGSAWDRGLKKGMAVNDRIARRAQFLHEVVGKSEQEAFTMSRITSGMANYMNWPGVVEDVSRATMYLNARRGGYSIGEARDMVNAALFDYSHGLSKFEQRVMKRLVPFYSFQRFATELVYKTFTQKLGKAITLGKGFDGMLHAVGKAFGGEELTPSERASIPGWLLEQPAAVAGFNEQMKLSVKTFNSFSPLDVLTFATLDETEQGEVRGVRRWLEKTFLAQMTPFIKMPVELFLKRNAFTGRQLENKYTGISEQKLGKVDPEDAMGALVAGVVSMKDEGTLAMLFGAGTMMAGKANPDLVRSGLKKILGWEERVDPKTGERQAYVNAYQLHVVSSLIPGLNHALRPTKQQYTPLQRAMSTIFGIHTFDVDLKDTRSQKLTNNEYEYRRRLATAKAWGAKGSEENYQKALEDLQLFVAQLRKEHELLTSTPVRGAA